MNKEEPHLICPSCKIIDLDLIDEKYYCQQCEYSYQIKDGYPILINFGLENVLIKENEIKIEKKKNNPNSVKNKILNFLFGISEVTEINVEKFLNILINSNKTKVLVIGGATKGSGTNKLWENEKINITSIDLVGTSNVDYIVDAHYLPFKKETFDAIWIQAVLEHVVSPSSVVEEIFRVIKNGGIVYSEIPFMQQIHMGKYDFTRYTGSGHRYLFKEFKTLDIGIIGGPGTSLAWSIKYFIWSFTSEKLANYLTIFLFFVFRLLDKFLSSRKSWDSSSGFYFFGKKDVKYKFDKEELNQIYIGKQI